MEFLNPDRDAKDRFAHLEEKFSGLSQRQNSERRYFPLLISWKSWSWKDTVLSEVRKVLKARFWIIIEWTQQRYLSRERREWEESSPINFVSREKIMELDLGFWYEFSWNLYWLDVEWIWQELRNGNTSIVNGSPEHVRGLFDILFKLSQSWILPPCWITFTVDLLNNERLLDIRWWNPRETLERKQAILRTDHAGWLNKKLSRYRGYNNIIPRNPHLDPIQNQNWFNQDVLSSIEIILNHVQKYLNMTPQEIQTERNYFYREHLGNRP